MNDAINTATDNTTDTLAESQALLDDPAHAENPLRPVLSDLLALCLEQQQRLNRLVRISDGYHQITHSRNLTLVEHYERQLRRLEKITRISDHYHDSLREASAALEEAAMTDTLTGLRNRRYLMEQLKKESLRGDRQGEYFALAILDIDFFKAINDRFGHEAGDVTLAHVARAIQASIRGYDICGRWGGEEFLIVLPDTNLADAWRVVERVREAITEISLDCLEQEDQSSPQVTASIGLAVHQPGESYSAALDRADTALYAAKANGRNRTEVKK